MEAIRAPVAVQISRVSHDCVLSSFETAQERLVCPVVDPRGGAVDRPRDVGLGTEPDITSLLGPIQTDA